MHSDLTRDAGHHLPDLARLAFDRVAEDEGAIAGPLRDLRCGLERRLRSGDDAGLGASESRVTGFRSLGLGVLKPRHDRWRRGDAVALDDRPGVGERGRVRRGRTRGDHRRIVARHVGDDERDDPGGRGGDREAPALDGRQVLADTVDLIDAGAASEQRLVQGLLVVQRDSRRRRREQGGAAAGYQAEREVIGTEAFDEIENPSGRHLSGGVRNGMGGLDHLDPLQGPDAVAVARHDQAGERLVVRPMRFDGAGHRRRSLAGADDDRAPFRRRRKIAGHRSVGGSRRGRRVEHVPQQLPLSHRLAPPRPLCLGQPQADALSWPISWRASPSSTRAMPEWSHAAPPAATAALNSSWLVAVFGRLTPSARAPCKARFRSF